MRCGGEGSSLLSWGSPSTTHHPAAVKTSRATVSALYPDLRGGKKRRGRKQHKERIFISLGWARWYCLALGRSNCVRERGRYIGKDLWQSCTSKVQCEGWALWRLCGNEQLQPWRLYQSRLQQWGNKCTFRSYESVLHYETKKILTCMLASEEAVNLATIPSCCSCTTEPATSHLAVRSHQPPPSPALTILRHSCLPFTIFAAAATTALPAPMFPGLLHLSLTALPSFDAERRAGAFESLHTAQPTSAAASHIHVIHRMFTAQLHRLKRSRKCRTLGGNLWLSSRMATRSRSRQRLQWWNRFLIWD